MAMKDQKIFGTAQAALDAIRDKPAGSVEELSQQVSTLAAVLHQVTAHLEEAIIDRVLLEARARRQDNERLG